MSSGHLAVYDCAQAKALRQATSVCSTGVTALAFREAEDDQQ